MNCSNSRTKPNYANANILNLSQSVLSYWSTLGSESSPGAVVKKKEYTSKLGSKASGKLQQVLSLRFQSPPVNMKIEIETEIDIPYD